MDSVPVSTYEVSATTNLLLVLGGGLLSSFLCALSTCSAASFCERMNTCTKTTTSICGFQNKVSTIIDSDLGVNSSTESLSTLLRGLCSPGDRTERDTQTGEVVCAPFFPYPSGIHNDIADPEATTPATRVCGKWIDAGGPPMSISRVSRRGSFDNSQWNISLHEAEDAATRDPRLATTVMSKFRAECKRTTLAGSKALRSAAMRSYNYFDDYMNTNAADRRGFLRSIGFAMGHRCAATIVAGSYINQMGKHELYIRNGYHFSSDTLSNALSMFYQSVELQGDADEANKEIYKLHGSRAFPQLTTENLYDILEGATGITKFTVNLPAYNLTLLAAALMYYDTKPLKAVAYLKGIFAFCSYTPWSGFLKSSSSYSIILDSEINKIRSDRPPANRLGRMKQVEEEVDPFYDALNANTLTLAHVTSTVSNGDIDADCLNLMRAVFSDEVEAARFQATVPARLYKRLDHLVLATRVAVGFAANTEPLRGVISNASLFAHRAANAGVRIVGAPRDSWAGLARPIPRAEILSSDGMFVQILKQSRASFVSEVVNVGLDESISACDHAPFASQTSWNAYILRGIDCSVYFLGILHRPMGDLNYDDPTLMSRFMHVVAHELSHIAENVGFNDANYKALLRYYHKDTLTEAIADVIGAVSILHTGMVTRSDFIKLFCGVWCSREPFGWTHPTTDPPTVHPSGNSRCDNLVYTLDEFFPNLGL